MTPRPSPAAPPDVSLAWAPVPPGTPRRDVAWELIRGLAGPGIRIANPCPRCGGPHGPVALPGSGLRASVAYSGDLALAAVASAACALGLDAEPVGRAAPLLRDDAGDPLRRWVRVEAVLKASGHGLSLDPATVAIATDDAGAPIASLPGASVRFRILDLAGPAGHLVSAAVAVPAAAG